MPRPLLPGEYRSPPRSGAELEFRISVATIIEMSYSVEEIRHLTGDRCPAAMFIKLFKELMTQNRTTPSFTHEKEADQSNILSRANVANRSSAT